MKEIECPVCRRRVRVEVAEANGTFPFCSRRCQMTDLGRWLTGSYRIPGKKLGQDEGSGVPEGDFPGQKSS